MKVANTSSDDFDKVLNAGGVSVNVYLRRLHNFALDMNWLLAPVIAKRAWPKVKHSVKRAVTLAEPQRIVEREKNPEKKAFYEICWHIGGAQSDMAKLKAADIDLQNRTISYNRQKNGSLSTLVFGGKMEKLLRSLPVTGNLFPYLAGIRETDRATEFKQRCKGLNIQGVTLHSYRYASAERAVAAGYGGIWIWSPLPAMTGFPRVPLFAPWRSIFAHWASALRAVQDDRELSEQECRVLGIQELLLLLCVQSSGDYPRITFIRKNKKAILKARFGIAWYSPAEMNPGYCFD